MGSLAPRNQTHPQLTVSVVAHRIPRFADHLLGLPVASHQLQCSYTSCSCPPDPLLLYCDLTYVPKLSLEIRDLCIIGGKLYEIEQRDFFHNATHIKSLQLQKCSIVSISSDALSCMKRLTKLDLSYNFISKFPESCDASGNVVLPALVFVRSKQKRD
ncbi:hypothetical protein BaRGS_00005396 [Batillaria attramentaria]|uniref:Uncharacterized protein n=1 Tax=Batillaria attramentaria TaxID=370345 RepID=A0ABD0LWE2_9CAEN